VRALAVLALAAGCTAFLNKDFTHEPAPPIEGGTWIAGAPPTKEWRVVTFFDPEGERSIANVAGLEALEKEFGGRDVDVIAITLATEDDARRFAKEHGVTYDIEADGGLAFEKWGIGSAEHAPIYVVDPNDMVLTEGYDDCVELLRERLGGAVPAPGAPENRKP
jgi:hypothetical protein